MSYRIEYDFKVSRVPASLFADGLPRFFVCIEGGDNNCYDSNGRRARSWSVCMMGTKDDILEQSCYFAVACEGDGLKVNGRSTTAEQYIRKIRKLVEKADAPSHDYAQHFKLQYKCPPDSEEDKMFTAAGISRSDGTSEWSGHPVAHFRFENENGNPDYKLFFDTIPLLGPNHASWDLAKCHSLY